MKKKVIKTNILPIKCICNRPIKFLFENVPLDLFKGIGE